MWNLWFNGRPVDRIGPYRFLHPYDLDGKTSRHRFIVARKVMQFIVDKSGVSASVISSSSSDAKVRHLQTGFTAIFQEWYGIENSDERLNRRSVSEMSVLSFYELMKGDGKRKEKSENH
jgi:hypothetical protein